MTPNRQLHRRTESLGRARDSLRYIRSKQPSYTKSEMFNRIKRWFSRPKNPAGHVYNARLKTPQGTFYKLGYTSKLSLNERMAFGNQGVEKLIDREMFFTFREDAWDVEQTLLEHFNKHRAFGKYSNDPSMPLSGRGQSELFVHDVLGLDIDLKTLSDQESKALQDELAKANDGCLMVLFGLVLVPFTLGLSLLFIAGGVSGVLDYVKGRPPVAKHPQHPPKIRKLLDELTFTGHVPKSAA